MMRRFATVLLAAGIAACSAPRPETTAEASAAPSYGPDAPAGMAITDARVQLPAVPGRPAVAYFTLRSSNAPAELTGVDVAHFARAEMHESKMAGGLMTMDPVERVKVAPGKPVQFAPGGYHVMLFDGDGALKAGQTTDLTVTLGNGDKVSASAKVIAAGGDAGM